MPIVQELRSAVTNSEGDLDASVAISNALMLYRSRPGFFTPYRSVVDFGSTLVEPVVAPVGFAVLTGLLGVASALAATVCVSSFVASGIAAALRKEDARDEALTVGVITGIIALAAPLLAALTALAVVLSFLHSSVALVTRSSATVVSAIGNGVNALAQCCHAEENDAQEANLVEMNNTVRSPM